MTNRNLLFLGIAAVAMVLITVALYSGSESSRSDFKSGTLLVQGLDPEKVASIIIREGDDAVTLIRHDDSYVVKEKSNYPALVKQVNDVLTKCMDIRCRERITNAAENYAELGVTREAGFTVSFLDAEAKQLLEIIKGKSLEGQPGVYVRLANQPAVYSTTTPFYLETTAIAYVDKQLISVEKDRIKRVEVQAGDEDTYAIAKDESGRILLENIPEGKREKARAYEDVFTALSRLNMTDVVPADNLELVWDASHTCLLKENLAYTAELAEEAGKHYARLSARGPGVKSVNITKTESEESLKEKEAVLLAAETARKFNARHKGWVYEISSWSGTQLKKPLADLIEDIPAEETPEEITASHILIGYEGAMRSTAERSRDEAAALAARVLGEARAEGADFAALARKYSDGPSRDKGGDLGSFKKGMMAKPFEEAAFKLKVGEISGVVETQFGFHIIKRTK